MVFYLLVVTLFKLRNITISNSLKSSLYLPIIQDIWNKSICCYTIICEVYFYHRFRSNNFFVVSLLHEGVCWTLKIPTYCVYSCWNANFCITVWYTVARSNSQICYVCDSDYKRSLLILFYLCCTFCLRLFLVGIKSYQPTRWNVITLTFFCLHKAKDD